MKRKPSTPWDALKDVKSVRIRGAMQSPTWMRNQSKKKRLLGRFLEIGDLAVLDHGGVADVSMQQVLSVDAIAEDCTKQVQ